MDGRKPEELTPDEIRKRVLMMTRAKEQLQASMKELLAGQVAMSRLMEEILAGYAAWIGKVARLEESRIALALRMDTVRKAAAEAMRAADEAGHLEGPAPEARAEGTDPEARAEQAPRDQGTRESRRKS